MLCGVLKFMDIAVKKSSVGNIVQIGYNGS